MNEQIGRVVGLDPGERWLGVAVGDGESRLALPLGTIDRRAQDDDGVARIRALLGPEGASLVVVGVPLDREGREDAQAVSFRALGERIAQALGLPLAVQSERHSNPPPAREAKASQRGHLSPARQRRRRRQAHALAAATILQDWLDGRAGDTGATPMDR